MAKQHISHDELTEYINELRARLVGVEGSVHALLELMGKAVFALECNQAEEAARQSEERLQLAMEITELGTWDYDALTGEVTWSDTVKNIFGLAPDAEASYDNWLECVHPDDRERMHEMAQKLADPSEEGKHRDEYRVIRPDGTVRWIDSNGQAFFREIDGELRLVRFIGTITDITERKESAEAMRASQEMLQLVMDNIPEHIFWKDRNSVYLGCNKNFAIDAGVGDPANIVGKTDYDLAWKREEAEFFREYDRRVMDTDTPILHIIEPVLQAGGREAWVDTNKIPLHDSQGNVVGILGTYEDITEHKLLEIEKENARKALEEVYERERKIAETLQRNLLPEKIPELDGYRFAEAYYPALSEAAIGGDVYDVFCLPTGKIGITIADVSGKGLRAARYGAMIKYTLRAGSYRADDPAEIMSMLNVSVASDLSVDEFITCFFGILDPVTGILAYASAGHDEPLYVSRSTGIPVRIHATGLALGVERCSIYTSGCIILSQGDVLLLYTDGVTEARGVQGPMYIDGLERYMITNCTLSADSLVECILNEVRRRSGDKLADDIAMVALEVTKQPPASPVVVR